MILVLNRNWGGFSLPQAFCDAYNLGDPYNADVERDDPRLIQWVRDHADHRGKCEDLGLVEFPDNCTDYEIEEYDGYESIIYVMDGKIRHA